MERKGLYRCWFCNKVLKQDEVFWVGNIKRPVCEEHKNSLNELLESAEELEDGT